MPGANFHDLLYAFFGGGDDSREEDIAAALADSDALDVLTATVATTNVSSAAANYEALTLGVLGTLNGAVEVFDAEGVSLGFLPVYSGITETP